MNYFFNSPIAITIFEMIFSIFFASIEMVFIRYMCTGRDNPERQFFIFSLILFVLNWVNNVICFNLFKIYVLALFISVIINIVVPFIYLLCELKKSDKILKLILPFLFESVYIIAFLIAIIVRCFLHTATFFDEMFAVGRERVIVLALTSLIMSVILLIFSLYKHFEKSGKATKLLYISAVIPIFTMVYFMFSPLIEAYGGVSNGFAAILNMPYETLYVIGTIIVSLSGICTYFLLFEMWHKNKIEKEKNLYQNMLTLNEKRYNDIKASSNQIRKIRHDIKNMLYSVKAELEENNISKAKERLNNILDNVNSVGAVVKSENRTVDYIVNAKLSNLDNKKVNVSGDASGLTHINDIDISIILGNLLDNTIEATEKIDKAEISLTFFIKDNCQNILCKNTIIKSVLKNNPKLKTQKPDNLLHGFGIKSIKDKLNCYGGTINIFEENSMFCVHIMIPIQ